MLKAILFDLDGTLIDSERFHYESWLAILAEWDISITYEEWVKSYAGIPLPANAQRFIEKYNINITHQELIEKVEQLTIERFKTSEIKLMPYVQETLEFFAEKDLTLALVTSSPRPDVETVFQKSGLKHFFKLSITRSDVTNSKPHPESYNVCRDQLGLEKEECLVFEDTLNGTKAAKAAGLVCFAIQSNTDEYEKLAIADKIFSDFKEAKDYLLQTGQIA